MHKSFRNTQQNLVSTNKTGIIHCIETELHFFPRLKHIFVEQKKFFNKDFPPWYSLVRELHCRNLFGLFSIELQANTDGANTTKYIQKCAPICHTALGIGISESRKCMMQFRNTAVQRMRNIGWATTCSYCLLQFFEINRKLSREVTGNYFIKLRDASRD